MNGLIASLSMVGTAAFAGGAGTGPALFEDVHAVVMPKAMYGYRGMNGDLLQLRDGTILWAYSDKDILVRKSRDLGRTWSEPEILVPAPRPPAKGNIAHPSLLRLPNGDILLAYIYIYNTYPTTPYFGHNYLRRSADEGKTWTDQYCYTPWPGYVPVHNDRLQRLSTGRIIATAEYKAYMPSSNDHNGYVGMTFFSDDDGYSWRPSRNTVDLYKEHHIEVQEADVVELRDGRLLMFARTYSGFAVFAYSDDRGETWDPGIVRRDIPMPYAGLPTVRRIPATGDLLFIWISEKSVNKQNPKVHWRCALTTAISKDEGKTLIHRKNIRRDPEDDFGYQCVEFVGDDLVLIGYHARDGLHLARIGVSWFYTDP